MISIAEEQSKRAPGQLALVQALVNTQYGQGRYLHTQLLCLDDLHLWLVQHRLLTDETPITEGDFRRIVQLREALRSLLLAHNGSDFLASQIEMLNRLAGNAPLVVHFEHDGSSTLQPDRAGVDGAIAHLVGIVFTSMTDGSWARLKACRNDRCQKAFYDSSKNRSGAWCSMTTCGSRVKALAYQHRRTADREG